MGILVPDQLQSIKVRCHRTSPNPVLPVTKVSLLSAKSIACHTPFVTDFFGPKRSAAGGASGHSPTSGKLKSGRWFQQRFGGLLSDSSAAIPVLEICDLPAPP
jgi:hypothetical protein